MKKIFIHLLIGCLGFLTACSDGSFLDFNSQSYENLLTPPLTQNSQKEKFTELQSVVGENIKLKYLQTQSSAALVTRNLQSAANVSADEQTLAFYEKTDTADKHSMRMCFWYKDSGGKTTKVYDEAVPGIEVEELKVSEIGSGSKKIFAGYSTAATNLKLLEGYSFDGEKLNLSFSKPYTLFDIADVDGNGENELIIITSKNQSENAALSIYTYKDKENKYLENKIYLSDSANIPQRVYFDFETNKIYIESNIENSKTKITEIFVFKDSILDTAN